MNIKKGTHASYRTELFMPIMKEAEGKYIAVLSDDSVDRDEERISRGCIERMGNDETYLAALCNHDNDVFMQVAEWTNRGMREIDGHTALVAEPRFFKSNPNAKIIQGMLDEGAKLGISIGAMVKNYDEIDGTRVYTELELVEASFVAVPSNRHGRAMAVAKSFNKKSINKKSEDNTMSKEFTQKDLDSALETKSNELKADFEKKMATKDAEITNLQKDLTDSKEETVTAQKALDTAKEEAKTASAEAETKKAALEKELDTAKKTALEKQKHANQGGENDNSMSEEDVNKAFKAGELPVMLMN